MTTKIAEVLSARSEIGELRRKCDLFEQENEKWKKKQQLLQKMCMDLNTVMKRFIVDKQNNTKDKVAPIKITRSVGLQVVTDRNRRTQQQQPQKPQSSGSNSTSTQAPKPGPASRQAQAAQSSAPATMPSAPPKPVVYRQIQPAPAAASPVSVAPALLQNGQVVKYMAKPTPVTPVTLTTTMTNNQRLQTLPASVSIIQSPPVNTNAMTSQASASPASNTASNTSHNKVIDVVDLSDDEDQQVKVPMASRPGSGVTVTKAGANTSINIVKVL